MATRSQHLKDKPRVFFINPVQNSDLLLTGSTRVHYSTSGSTRVNQGPPQSMASTTVHRGPSGFNTVHRGPTQYIRINQGQLQSRFCFKSYWVKLVLTTNTNTNRHLLNLHFYMFFMDRGGALPVAVVTVHEGNTSTGEPATRIQTSSTGLTGLILADQTCQSTHLTPEEEKLKKLK